MITTIADRLADSHLMREAAAPLAAVLRAISEAPGAVTPGIAAAALTLAAEQITVQAEACPKCSATEGDLCTRCTEASARAPRAELTICPECGATEGKRGPFRDSNAVRTHRARKHGILTQDAERGPRAAVFTGQPVFRTTAELASRYDYIITGAARPRASRPRRSTRMSSLS
jgi:ribosomal protein S27AE